MIQIAAGVLLLKSAFALRTLMQTSREIEIALRNGGLEEARRLTAWHLVSRDTSNLDQGHIISAVVESLAENLTDSLLAPLLAYTIGGTGLAWLYRFSNTADAMIGYHDRRHEYYGKLAARLDDLLNFIPARLAGLLICVAAFITGEHGMQSWKTMIHQHSNTASPNAGWSMSAIAGALNSRLEKIGHYSLCGGPRLPGLDAIARTRRLVWIASSIWLGACLVMGVIFSGLPKF